MSRIVLPKGDVHDDVLSMASNSMRIGFLEYSPDNGHAELTDSLAELGTRVEEYRDAQLRETMKW
ncbi:MAG: hypothetical protein WBV93_09190 [Anaerobacillus sp.]